MDIILNKKSKELVDIMEREGYSKEFAALIASEMNTDYTADRMIAYILRSGYLPMREVADEMLSIIDERDAIKAKKNLEYNQSVINRVIRYGFDDE